MERGDIDLRTRVETKMAHKIYHKKREENMGLMVIKVRPARHLVTQSIIFQRVSHSQDGEGTHSKIKWEDHVVAFV